MALNRKLRAFFFQITNVVRLNGTTGGIRFRTKDQPTQEVMNNLVDSAAFMMESDDRAKLYTGALDLSVEQGLSVLATDAQAKSNAAQLTDRSLVVQPHQLPTVETNTAQNIPSVNDVPAFSDIMVPVFNDPGTTTRNRYLPFLSVSFLTWITNNILPRLVKIGGTTGQIYVKNSNTNFDAGWVSAASFSETYNTTSTTNLVVPNTVAPIVFTVASSTLAYKPGNRLRAVSVANPSHYIEGICTSYTGTTLNLLADNSFGSPNAYNSWNIGLGAGVELPPQSAFTGADLGKIFLSTNGAVASWTLALPSQATNAGKLLTTDGTNASWVASTALPDFGKIKNSAGDGIPDYLENKTVQGLGINIATNGFNQRVFNIANSTGYTNLTMLNGWTGAVAYFVSGRTVYLIGSNLDNTAATDTTMAQLPSVFKPTYNNHYGVMIHTNGAMATPMACYPIEISAATGNVFIKYNFASMPTDSAMYFSVSYPVSL